MSSPKTIHRHIIAMQRRRGKRIRAQLADNCVWIWSDEAGLWWRPNSASYTSALAAAGIYAVEDARKRDSLTCWRAAT